MIQSPQRPDLQVVAGRAELIECIDNGMTDKRTIEDRLNKSRSTINRWLNDLLEADIITPKNNGYQLTLLGKLAHQEYAQFEHRFSDVLNAKPLLGYLPTDTDFDTRILQHAEILVSHEIAPQEPIHRLEELVQNPETQTIRGTSPVILPRYVDFFHHQIMSERVLAEFVLESTVFEYLLSAYPEKVTDIMESERGTFSQVVGYGLPYGLVIGDPEGVWVGIYEPGGGLRGAISNTSIAAIEWGNEQYDSMRTHAEVLDQNDVMVRGAT